MSSDGGKKIAAKFAVDFGSIGGYSLSMKTKNVYYSERQAQCYRDINERGGMPNAHGGLSMVDLNRIRLDDGRVVTYTEICDGKSTSRWDDLKLIGSIPYEGDFDYSRCTTKGYW